MNCLRLQTEVGISLRKALAEKRKMHNSASLQLKLFDEATFFISAEAAEEQPNLRLKPEAIIKRPEAEPTERPPFSDVFFSLKRNTLESS